VFQDLITIITFLNNIFNNLPIQKCSLMLSQSLDRLLNDCSF